MLWTTVLGLFLGFWSGLFLVDFYLRAAGLSAYIQFAERTGLIVSPFKVRWYTGSLQRWLSRVSLLRRARARRLLSVWFTAGACVALVASGLMLFVLSRVLALHLAAWLSGGLHAHGAHVGRTNGAGKEPLAPADAARDSAALNEPHSRGDRIAYVQPEALATDGTGGGGAQAADDTAFGLVPIVPGVNVPWPHVPVLLLALIIAAVIHELGHAIAAINDDVAVNGFGVFVFAIYPGAFTELATDSLAAQPRSRQLRIYAAGIWHNVVLAAVAAALFYAGPPLAASCGFMVGKGVAVAGVDHRSGLRDDSAGLAEGDVIYAVNYCKVRSAAGWHECLWRLSRTHYGYCVPRAEVAAARSDRMRLNKQAAAATAHTRLAGADEQAAVSELDCCPANASDTHLCFYYRSLRPPVAVASGASDFKARHPPEQSCLPAKHVTEHHVCDRSLPCRAPKTHCVYPALFNSTKLLRFFVANRTKTVLFVGQPTLVADYVSVRSHVPVSRLAAVLAWGNVPEAAGLLCQYIVTLSLALGLLNAVPCYSLDGQFITEILCEAACAIRGLSPSRRASTSPGESAASQQRARRLRRLWQRRLYKAVLAYGTFVLAANVFLAMYKFAIR